MARLAGNKDQKKVNKQLIAQAQCVNLPALGIVKSDQWKTIIGGHLRSDTHSLKGVEIATFFRVFQFSCSSRVFAWQYLRTIFYSQEEAAVQLKQHFLQYSLFCRRF